MTSNALPTESASPMESIFRLVAENTSDTIVVVDSTAVVRFVSPSIETVSGYSPEEYGQMDAFALIHPEDEARVRALHAEAIRTKQPVDMEYRVIHKDGSVLYAETRVKPVLDAHSEIRCVVAVVRDITERKLTERRLEESEQKYRSLFQNNLDGVFSIDTNLYFIHANPAFEAITGIELAKLPDRCFIGLVYDEDHPLVYETLFRVMSAKEPRDLECRLQRGGQGEIIVSITFVPILVAGELHGAHGIVKDITARKREELELIRSEERYKLLQQSLNRYSNNLARVMKVSELEHRLIAEVREVLQVAEAEIEEWPSGQEPRAAENELRVKIGEKQHPVYLRIVPGRSFLRIEEEWLDTVVHYATLLYDNLQLIEDLMNRLEGLVSRNETPKWMLRLLFKLSEKERAALSSDLHDTVLQDLIIWYRKLESLRSSGRVAEETREALIPIEEGLLDAIHQIRITCNELRPPFLLKMGLVESLKSLLSYTRMFANYEIEFTSDPLDRELTEEEVLGLYRVVQELLNNASKHSRAGVVRMELVNRPDGVGFTYDDDGVGMDLSAFEGSFQHMGITGIEKRVFSFGGEVAFRSAPGQGFHVNILIPKNEELR